jgi:hypothetical protein
MFFNIASWSLLTCSSSIWSAFTAASHCSTRGATWNTSVSLQNMSTPRGIQCATCKHCSCGDIPFLYQRLRDKHDSDVRYVLTVWVCCPSLSLYVSWDGGIRYAYMHPIMRNSLTLFVCWVSSCQCRYPMIPSCVFAGISSVSVLHALAKSWVAKWSVTDESSSHRCLMRSYWRLTVSGAYVLAWW